MLKSYSKLLVLTLIVLAACQQRTELTPVLNIAAVPSVSSPANGTALVLEEANADQVVADFSWAPADFGFQAAVTYKPQLDKQGNDFADPITLGVINTTSITDMTVGELNGMLLAKGIPDGVATTMEMRVVATVSDDVDPVNSEVITIDITPYKAQVEYGILNVPGSYQGWDPASETTVIYSREANDSYEGFLAFPDAGTAYKFAKGSWADNWGDTGADGTLDPGGDDIVANEPGMYMFTADLAALTYTAEKTDWGLIGSATPDAWDADQDMTLDQATGTWAITLDLIEGEIKFRSNDDWGLNFGDTGANGSLERDGDNIVIGEAGNYTIELMLNVADYTYTVTKN
ncbi:MAG: SusE domain-containing protein [Bacteroidota bacterium]